MKTITAHVMVKNEDRYLWYAIKSVIDFVDKLIIFDTGSTDNTIDIIELLCKEYGKKIIFENKGIADRGRLGKLRQEMLEMTDTDYFMILDGDEIWWEKSIKEAIDILNHKEPYLLATHYINCARDIWHYREPSRDVFPFLDKKAAASIRFYSMNIPGIHCGGAYGVEGFWDEDECEVQCGKYKIEWQLSKYFHTSYIQRSTKQYADMKAFSRVKKMVMAYDYKFEKNYAFPEVFYLSKPNIVKSPFENDVSLFRKIIYFVLDGLKVRRIIDKVRELIK